MRGRELITNFDSPDKSPWFLSRSVCLLQLVVGRGTRRVKEAVIKWENNENGKRSIKSS